MGRDEKNDTTKSGVSDGIAREERDGLTFMLWGRLIVLAALALWVTLTVPIERSGTYLLVIAAFAIIGVAPYILTRWELGGARVTALFLLLDIGVLCYILLVPAPFSVEGWTPQLNLRLPNILFLGISWLAWRSATHRFWCMDGPFRDRHLEHWLSMDCRHGAVPVRHTHVP
jgi:adenylate cyclase